MENDAIVICFPGIKDPKEKVYVDRSIIRFWHDADEDEGGGTKICVSAVGLSEGMIRVALTADQVKERIVDSCSEWNQKDGKPKED